MSTITGTAGADSLVGTGNSDELDGLDGNDTLDGGASNDVLVGGNGADVLIGGAGTLDIAAYAYSTAGVNVSLDTGTGTGGEAEGDTLSGIERLVGSAFNDIFTSSISASRLEGAAGNDIYNITSGVIVAESAGAGLDEVRTTSNTLSIAGFGEVEILTFTGTGNFNGTGGSDNNTITGGAGNDTLVGGGGADYLDGGSGTDTASYANTSSAVSLNFKTGVHTGDAAGDTFSGIEKFQGSSGNDTFVSGTGADNLDGYTGSDTVDYSTSASGVTANLTTGVVSGGDAAGDVLVSIEKVVGSNFADNLSSSTASTTLVGGAGDDVYVVGATTVSISEATGGGTDEVQTALSGLNLANFGEVENLTYTGAGAFTGYGNSVANTITGGSGNDTLAGNGGADLLIGNGGTDTATYSTTASAVTLNFKTGVHTGDAAGDTFSGIEKFQGSSGNDTFVSGTGADNLDGYTGTDVIDYSTSASGVTINLTTGIGSAGDAAGDVLTSFEKIVGSSFADNLSSSTASTTLAGGAGDDIYVVGASTVSVSEATGDGTDEIQTSLSGLSLANYGEIERLTYTGAGAFTGYGGAGANTLTGGAGNDTLAGNGGADLLVGNGGTDTATYSTTASTVTLNFKTGVHTGDAAGDVFSGIEKYQGSSGNDTFVSGTGADNLDGYTGTDTVDYSTSASAVSVDLTAGTGSGGDAAGDILTAIERVVGSNYADTLTSSTAGHVLEGGLGNDVYVANSTSVTIVEQAGAGTDEVRTNVAAYQIGFANIENLTYTGTAAFSGYGNALDNVITGGIGNDVLIGKAGADTLNGGAGTDTASYLDTSAGMSLDLKTGIGTGDAAGDVFNSIEKYQGSLGNDTFYASSAADNIDGNSGTDTISYASSASGVSVDLTNQIASGGDAAGDVLTGFEKVIGSTSTDTLSAATSGYVLQGGAGNDVYVVGNAGVSVIENVGEGTDEVRTSLTSISIANYANVENLTFIGTTAFSGAGNASANIITGGSGNDTLTGAAGADTLNGGSGTDIANYSNATAGVTIDLKTGAHTGDAAGDVFNSIEGFLGSTFNDTFIADGNATSFNGYSGTLDTVDYSQSAAAVSVDLGNSGGSGSGGDAAGDTYSVIERVIGSAGNDTLSSASVSSDHYLVGGAGNDIYVVNGSHEHVSEDVGGGDDEVRTGLSGLNIAAWANVERLTYTGTGNFTGYGNSGNNVITGGSGNDLLVGYSGADQLIGGGGTDTASYAVSTGTVLLDLKTGASTGDAAGDTYISIEKYQGSAGNDTFVSGSASDVLDGNTGIDTIDYSTSAAAITVNLTAGTGVGGDAQGDVLTAIEHVVGTSFADTLSSSTSGHVLEGGLGDDVYVVGNSGVNVVEAASGGTDTVQTTLATLSIAGYANVENLTYTGAGSFYGTGNVLDNVITGGAGNDTLIGGAGADTLVGGGGMDTASYNTSTVALTFNLATGTISGDGIGDVFSSIEALQGSSYADKFIAGASADHIDGGGGFDLADYSASTSGITLNLTTGVHSGLALGDAFYSIEIFQATSYADSLTGDANANIFIGGAGADTIDGAGGSDISAYWSSGAGITVDLSIGTAAGGDAAGDVLTNVEGVIGTSFNDSIVGNAAANRLEGGWGDDTISGGDGDDTIWGGFTIDTSGQADIVIPSTTAQADLLSGGNGNDQINSLGDDLNTVVHGDAGNDSISVASADAYGDAGNDFLIGHAADFRLFGGAGDDQLYLDASGYAYGNDGTDVYHIETTAPIVIDDDGATGVDSIYLNISSVSDLVYSHRGNDLFITTVEDVNQENGLLVVNFYAGDVIENFYTLDLTHIVAADFV